MKNKNLAKCIIGYSLILGVFLGGINRIQPSLSMKETNKINKNVQTLATLNNRVDNLYLGDLPELTTYYNLGMHQEKEYIYDYLLNTYDIPHLQVIQKE